MTHHMKLIETSNRLPKIMAAVTGLVFFGCATEVPSDFDSQEDNLEKTTGIWNGTSAASNLAVVELRRWQGDGAPEAICTGFFITMRHILTAAHCTDSAAAGGSGWYRVRVKTGNNSFTNLKQTDRSDTRVRMQEAAHPNWSFATMPRAADTAILTIPASAASSVPASQARLRISTAAPVTNQSLEIWGWGKTTPNGAAPGDLMTGNNGAQITVSGISTDGSSNWLYAYATGNARTCQGDSGGPATRYQDGNYVAVGDHRGPYYVDGSGSFWPCAEANVRMDWPTLYDKTAFIETTLRGVYGAGFSCGRYSSGSGAYMRCW